MNRPHPNGPRIALACGGTGGHLFPGLAVAGQLARRGCDVILLISAKEVDQQGIRQAPEFEVHTLPAVGLTRGRAWAFFSTFAKSYRASRALFRPRPPQAALAMGGFTSAPPLLAARRCGARTFLHESNAIPGRANRWLSWIITRAFVGFPQAAARLHTKNVMVTGTPVRPQFQPLDAAACRQALGLAPERRVVLVMGGSQGAAGINELVARALPGLASRVPQWQWIHLAGAGDAAELSKTYSRLGFKALVVPFLDRMELAMGAADAAVSRAGASSLAELAAMRLPAVLIPYPSATDNHQFHNARAFEQSGAARLLDQSQATPEALIGLLDQLMDQSDTSGSLRAALAAWHAPQAAERVTEMILDEIAASTALSDSPTALVPRRCL